MKNIARSSSPWGPFEPCPTNPILSHRHRAGHPIQATGHADIIQAHDSSFWAVFLGIRPQGYPPVHHLGREKFLAPVRWTDAGWPVIGNQGTIEPSMEVEPLAQVLWPEETGFDDFDLPNLKPCWNFLRNPQTELWSVTRRAGWLCLNGSGSNLTSTISLARPS